jgi:hypothetical protein
MLNTITPKIRIVISAKKNIIPYLMGIPGIRKGAVQNRSVVRP